MSNAQKGGKISNRISTSKTIVLLLMALALACFLPACATTETPDSGNDTPESGSVTESIDVRVSSLKGPTSIGLAEFITSVEDGEDTEPFAYEFTMSGSPDEVLPGLMNGDIDIALIPANVASVLYNRTEGGIQVLNINTLGVLHVVSGDTSITSLEDLAGKTVIMSGKGAIPEIVMKKLLDEAGLTDSVTLDFKSEASEVAALLSEDTQAIAVLPEPFATSVVMKVPELDYRLDLTDVWEEMGKGEWGQLITGVTVARVEFAEEHPDVIEDFMTRQAASIEEAKLNPDMVAPMVVRLGIVDDEEIAENAIPRSNLAFVDGSGLKNDLEGFLQVLYDFDPEFLGGSLPTEEFYYHASIE